MTRKKEEPDDFRRAQDAGTATAKWVDNSVATRLVLPPSGKFFDSLPPP